VSTSQAMTFFTPFALRMESPTSPRPPQPMTATQSLGPSLGNLLIPLYAVIAEQPSVAAKTSSMPEASTRYFGWGISTCEE